MTLHRLAWLAPLALLLAGCMHEYRYIPPPDPAGLQCVSRCGEFQAGCRQDAEERADREARQCEHNADIEFIACLRYARDNERERCQRRSCYPFAHTGHCEEEFRQCYQGCGGTVLLLQ